MKGNPLTLQTIGKNWWVLLIRGILAILFGILAFALPGATLLTLVLIYGIYALADGIAAIVVGARTRGWTFILMGALGIIVGILTFVYPGITAVVLLYLVAAWAIVRGIFEIAAAVVWRRVISNEWFLILGGVISIIFGAVMLADLAAGALAIIWLIGVWAVVFGIVLVILAFRVRGFARGD